MLKQGFVVLFRQTADAPLKACPIIAPNLTGALEAFGKSHPQVPSTDVVASLSLQDLVAHRRAILALAQAHGLDLDTQPPSA